MHDLGKHNVQRRRCHSHGQLPDLSSVRLSGKQRGMLHLPQDFSCFLQKGFAGPGQRNTPLVAMNELDLKLRLQLLQLLAEGWLRHMAPRCGAMEMKLFAKCDEGLQASTIHSSVIGIAYYKCKPGAMHDRLRGSVVSWRTNRHEGGVGRKCQSTLVQKGGAGGGREGERV